MKTLVLESLFNKVTGLQTCNFIKKRLQHRCFPVNIAKFLRTPVLKNICERLLLQITLLSLIVQVIPIKWRGHHFLMIIEYCSGYFSQKLQNNHPPQIFTEEQSEAATGGVLLKNGVLINFAEFTGKHLSQSLFFNKVTGLRPATLIKKRFWHRCFPVNFVKLLRTYFLWNISGGCF